MVNTPSKNSISSNFLNQLKYSHGNQDEIKRLFSSYIEEFKVLNLNYKFCSSFNEEYVYQQLDELFVRKRKKFSFIPFGIKDVFNTKVLPTEMGSEIWKDFHAGNNARIVDEIIHAGGIVFCKTTTAEFAVHYFDNNTTINPHNKNHITGTSSAGSAVAVSCGAIPVALATQTAGSIIRPASFCGVFGFKPSFGAIDRTGVLKTNDTLDTIGFIGADLDIIFKTFIELYQNTNDYPMSKLYLENYNKGSPKKPNILIIDDDFKEFSNYESYVHDSFEKATSIISKENNIVNVEKKELKFLNEIHKSHQTIYDKSLSYYFLEESKVHEKISDVMTDIISRGKEYSEENYIQELKNQICFTEQFNEILNKYNIDYIVTPSTASCAPLIGDREKDDTSLIWTYFGMPSVSLPLFKHDNLGLPYGLEVVAPRYNDFRLLKFANNIYSSYLKN